MSLSILALVTLIGLTLMSLSQVSVRSAAMESSKAQARANAKMALMVALGELQEEMGPDMRISAEAAIHDTKPEDEAIDGVAQPHWLAVYDSWGNWLNASYTPDGKEASQVSAIGDTYVDKRAPMFRRWLVSMPRDLRSNVNSAENLPNMNDSVVMVGEGTLGQAHAQARPEKVTRAYRIKASERDVYAWWIGPENHKAKVGLAAQEREELSADQWAVGQGVSSEVAIGAIDGFGSLDIGSEEAAERASRIPNFESLPLVDVEESKTKEMFFDLTGVSSGILSNTRSGGLKKDLSLLFENSDTSIPQEYSQVNRYEPEPSVRPLSKDILEEDAELPRRPFSSWPNMRHYYRMYHEDNDTEPPKDGRYTEYEVYRELQYPSSSGQPYAQPLVPFQTAGSGDTKYSNDWWFGENAYKRFPLISKLLIIQSYKAEYVDADEDPATPDTLEFFHYDTPIVTFWNPYNVPLIINSRDLAMSASSRNIWPHRFALYDESGERNSNSRVTRTSESSSPADLSTLSGDPIVFEPGAFRVFSFRNEVVSSFGTNEGDYTLYEGYDPFGTSAFRAADTTNVNNFDWFDVQYDHGAGIRGRPGSGNNTDGNVPGSLSIKNLVYAKNRYWGRSGIPAYYQVDWFQKSQQHESLLNGSLELIQVATDPLNVAYSLFTIKGVNQLDQAAPWAEDWRNRNWLFAPPYYYGSGLFMTEVSERRAHTQRLDSPYWVGFGALSTSKLGQLTAGDPSTDRQWLGGGSTPYERVSAAPLLELPTAPLSSIASFAGMRMTPGYVWFQDLNPDWKNWKGFASHWHTLPAGDIITQYNAINKMYAYQSGMTGPGIGNSFVHPMIPREDVYHYYNNSISHVQKTKEMRDNRLERNDLEAEATEAYDTKAYADYWDHVLLLNDALWDEYFISSIADQTRPWASASDNLQANLEALTAGEALPISRYQYYDGGLDAAEVQDKLTGDDAFMKAAEHLRVDGAFNVNSTSVNAWYAVLKGIRERKLFYRNASGNLKEVDVPDDHIALSRFDTPTTDKEMADASSGVTRDDGLSAWSGVRFLDDDQIRLLAEKCVEQVKKRGPFLNFSEFINRRLEDSKLGLMGALQSAIDYDDDSPEPGSINYRFKDSPLLRISPSDLGPNEYPTPEAVEGSRLAGIPGYVVQSDVLKPIANTLQVRDDTFRIRAYGEVLDPKGKVIGRAWCEAVVQRSPDYVDPANQAYEANYVYEGAPPNDTYDPRWDGEFVPNSNLSELNRRFGRRFEIKSFRWLNSDEV
ncbi:hypothetical protein [Coraliomargarita sinensis]|uniref:hypothetical protein n=1 Tax=Coraliomargarita sinensis TaxID=2174842 RepID=UPI001E4AB029|nr:hypothetical protein [Coraliomargarita sinensis]